MTLFKYVFFVKSDLNYLNIQIMLHAETKINNLIERSFKAPQKSIEWLQQRHNIITSSEVASALDANLYESSTDLLKRKCMPLSETNSSSKSTDWGEKYESIAKRIFEKITDEKITDVGLIIHETIPWLGASPDALVFSKKLLEIKCPFYRNIIDGHIPYYYWIQTQIQMEVCDLDECYFLQCKFEEDLSDINGYKYYGIHSNGVQWGLKKYTLNIIKRDREWFVRILPTLTQFYNKIEHYRCHGLTKLVADLTGKQVYYNLGNNQLEFLNSSPTLLSLQESRITSSNIPESNLQHRPDNLFNDVIIPESTVSPNSPSHQDDQPCSVFKNWDEWIAATAIRNYFLNDPILDWLNLYCKGPQRLINIDPHIVEDSIKQSSDFNSHLQFQGLKFEDEIIAYLYKKYPSDIITIANIYQARQPEKVNETLDALKAGIPIIYQAVLHNEFNKTYGVADLLIRSDFINKLFAHPVLLVEEQTIGCNLNSNYHYVVVDIKHITLSLRANGTHLLNQGSISAYKGQLCIYNDALSHIQGYKPTKAFILGRKWTYTTKGVVYSGNGWFDRLAEIDFQSVDLNIINKTIEAINWIKLVRSDGASWTIDPPSRLELYPNMCNDHDAPWHHAKKIIAKKIGEITQVYYAGINQRNTAIANGIYNWRDPACTALSMGHKGSKLGPIIDAILETNRSTDKIRYGNKNIKLPNPKVRFYIDFETVGDVIENIEAQNPVTTTQSYIFMIGIGWTIRGNPEWNYRCLTVDTINADNEKEIFLTMHDVMLEIIETNNAFDDCTVFHWSHAEKTFYEQTAEKYLDDMDQYASYLHWKWYDLYKLFISNPITVQGSLTFSLKDIASAMYQNGLIKTCWISDGILDGLSAMVKALECSDAAKKKGVSMIDDPVMKKIIDYNEVDCKVMMEIVEFIMLDISFEPPSKYLSKISKKPKRKKPDSELNELYVIPTKKTKVLPEILEDINDLPKSTTRSKKRKVIVLDDDTLDEVDSEDNCSKKHKLD